MIQDPKDDEKKDVYNLHPTLLLVSKVLVKLGLRVFVIGARSIMIRGIDLGRVTRDWDLTIDKPFTPELRDAITKELRRIDLRVQWRKWGLLVDDDIHVDINYAPLTMDEEFLQRSIKLEKNIFLPSLEDIIILKLMSGEKKDVVDLKRILYQSWPKLDKEYLYMRARQAGLEKELKKLLRRLDLQ